MWVKTFALPTYLNVVLLPIVLQTIIIVHIVTFVYSVFYLNVPPTDVVAVTYTVMLAYYFLCFSELPIATENEDTVVVLTILGVNSDVAIQAFLPVTRLPLGGAPVGHVTTAPCSSGSSTRACHVCERLNRTLTVVHSDTDVVQCSRDKHFIRSFERIRFLFVIDSYNPGDDVNEITLVRGYEIDTAAVDRSSADNT
jgi:hypothetical protein